MTLVVTDPTRCPECGNELAQVTADEPALLRHGGYGATRQTVTAHCARRAGGRSPCPYPKPDPKDPPMANTATAEKPAPAKLKSLKLRLPANEFADAWLKVALAQGVDHPVVERMCLEVFDARNVRLVATDSYTLFTATVGPDLHVGDLVKKPKRTLLVGGDRRLLTAALRRLRRSKNADVALNLTSAALELDCGDQVLRLPVDERDFVPWRNLVEDARKKPGGSQVALGPLVLPGLAGLLKDTPGGALDMRVAGALDPIVFKVEAIGSVPVHGLFMPVRVP